MLVFDKKIKTLVRHAVAEEIGEILSDPDYGLTLRKSFEEKLKKSLAEERRGRLIPFETILRKYS
ncbi:hypothetical protein L0Y69_01300 [bacterium]|nr:hypothetical protein [bacterium]